jgi:hypothetical protein
MNESLQPLPLTPRSGSSDPYTLVILHALKGPPGSILLALLSSAEPLGPRQLVVLTGWGETSIIAGLQKLALLGWAERRSRYNGWVLSDLARSTVLPRLFPAAFQAGQGAKDGGNSIISNSLSIQGIQLEDPEPCREQYDVRFAPFRDPAEDQDQDGNTMVFGSLPSEHPLEDHEPAGNSMMFGSLPSGDQAEDHEPAGNSMIFGSLPSEHPVEDLEPAVNIKIFNSLPSGDPAGDQAFAGNREIYSSNRTPGDARTACKQSSRASQGSGASKARASPARRYPPLKKRRASCDSRSSQFPEESQEEDLNLKTQDLSASSGSDFARPPQNGPPGRPGPPLSSAGAGEILDATGRPFGDRVMGAPARFASRPESFLKKEDRNEYRLGSTRRGVRPPQLASQPGASRSS